MAGTDESEGALTTMIDQAYEYSAPQYFDFVSGESEESQRRTELWFESALSCAPSPFMQGVKSRRSICVESLCDFEQMKKTAEALKSDQIEDPKPQPEFESSESKEEEEPNKEKKLGVVNVFQVPNRIEKSEDGNSTTYNSAKDTTNVVIQVESDASTPILTLANSKKQSAKNIASLVNNPSATKPKSWLLSSQSKNNKTSNMKRDMNLKNVAGAASLALENQPIKRQKLEEGRSKQILNIKPHSLQHKSKPGLNCGSSTANKTKKEDRKIYVRDPAIPFVSTAEMMQKFQSCTRDLSLPHANTNMKPKLTLTRPKEPELETAQRVRSIRVKSTDEVEEEMMANMPKYKATPLNKRILKAPTFHTIPRSTPQKPEFQEFHFETEARANQAVESASISSYTGLPNQNNNKGKLHLTEPKSPVLHTLLRARPPRVKTSSELEQEELEKIPKFRARPLNKKIFESKGELGLFSNTKKNVTQPQEFHFAATDRIPYPTTVADLFNKLAISFEPRQENPPIPKNTKPNPFHLYTEERGAEKERRFFTELIQKEFEEEKARIPKANPYPYTTDYPVILTKPEPKQFTKPEPFQLKSLVRHEEEMYRELEEKQRREKEEAEMRIFKAQPILREDPIPLPQKVRKPLTQVQSFNLHVDVRAVEREEFDQKIKEKEQTYKRHRDESEAARMVEEEKELKQMRKTMVPHARPVPDFGHPFLPQKSSKETTKAKSPNLRALQRKETRKLIRSAISSAAAQMR